MSSRDERAKMGELTLDELADELASTRGETVKHGVVQAEFRRREVQAQLDAVQFSGSAISWAKYSAITAVVATLIAVFQIGWGELNRWGEQRSKEKAELVFLLVGLEQLRTASEVANRMGAAPQGDPAQLAFLARSAHEIIGKANDMHALDGRLEKVGATLAMNSQMYIDAAARPEPALAFQQLAELRSGMLEEPRQELIKRLREIDPSAVPES